MLLREYLEAKDYDSVLCLMVKLVIRSISKTKFDIAVLDVMMPKKDGFTLAQDIGQG